MTEQREIYVRNQARRFRQLEVDDQTNAEQRKRPEIGYGTLFDTGDEHYDFTLSVDLALPDDADAGSVTELEMLVEESVIVWLALHAPKGTQTGVIVAIRE